MRNSTFKIGYIGVIVIKQHKTSNCHKNNCNASASNFLIYIFLVKANTKQDEVAQNIVQLNIIIPTTPLTAA